MKKFNILRLMMMAVISTSVMTFASCGNDDDEPVNTLELTPSKVEIAPEETATVIIGSGMAPFEVSSSNTKIATATSKDKTITITGVAEGSTVVKVTDKSKQTGQVIVTVKEASSSLTVDKESAELAVGTTVDVAVLDGIAPYAVAVEDSEIATASVEDSKITIKGIKAGKTAVTVTDKNKKSATINVTVK